METTQTTVQNESRATFLARQMYALRQAKAELETLVKAKDAELDQVRHELTDIMTETGVQKFALEGMGTFYLSTAIYPKLPNMEGLIQWLDKEGKGELAPRKVHVPSLKEFIEDRMEHDLPIPGPDLVEMTPETSVRLRMATNKKES